MRFWLISPLLAATFVMGGCTKDEDTSETGDSDADTDTDTDSDTDADYASFTGDVTFQRTVDTTVVCDVDVSLASTSAYTGGCANCEFAFNVDSTVTRDASTADCDKDYAYYLTTLQSGPFTDTSDAAAFSDGWIGFSSEYVYGGYTFNDVLYLGGTYTNTTDGAVDTYEFLFTSYTYTYGTDVYGPYASDYSTTTFDGTALDFEITLEGTTSEDLIGNDCSNAFGAKGTGAVDGTTLDGELSCTDLDKVDVYTLTVAANDALSISVDTTDAAKLGDAMITVYDGAGCLVWEEDDSFSCTVQPAADTDTSNSYDYCPAWSGTATTAGAGTYTIVVGAAWSCLDDPQATWTYRLAVSGGTGLTLSQTDIIPFAEHTTTTNVVGSGVAVAAQ